MSKIADHLLARPDESDIEYWERVAEQSTTAFAATRAREIADALRLASSLPCVGQRIRVLEMPDDPCPVPAGSIGTVLQVRQLTPQNWLIDMAWDDTSRSLALSIPPDRWEAVEAA
jgi:hypothetical protein